MGVTRLLLLGSFYTIQTKRDQTFWRGVYLCLQNWFGFSSTCRFLDDNQLSPGSNGSTMMNPSSNNGASTSWLFSGPNSGGGFHTPDHLGHGVHPGNQPPLPPTSNATFTPTSAFEDGRGGPQPAMIVPFSQTDLNFVDSLSIHQPSQQKNQQQQQTQHFVTSSTLHPSSLSVVEATDATGTFTVEKI